MSTRLPSPKPQAKPKGEEDRIIGEKQVVNLYFASRYFAHMNMGQTEDIQQVFPLPDWFAVGSTVYPYPAYGLATNVHIDTLTHPQEGNKSRFSWQLLPGKSAKCLHLFMRDQLEGFDARVGHLWYELFYQPLKAEIYPEASFTKAVTAPAFALP